jgi:hypothetical protein
MVHRVLTSIRGSPSLGGFANAKNHGASQKDLRGPSLWFGLTFVIILMMSIDESQGLRQVLESQIL